MGLEISVQRLYLGDREWRSIEVKRFGQGLPAYSSQIENRNPQMPDFGTGAFPSKARDWERGRGRDGEIGRERRRE